jgi:hypothetical protein
MITHTNRKGDLYYLKMGTTKTGKPKYYCSKKSAGINAESIPAGHEIYEDPNNRVIYRKLRPCLTNKEEQGQLAKALAKVKAATVWEAEDDALIVHSSEDQNQTMALLLSQFSRQQGQKWMDANRQYAPILKFCLTDPKQRHFQTLRMCHMFHPSDWIHIGNEQSLQKCLKTYTPLIDDESALFEILD